MKQEFMLKCYNGYGETIIRKFEARSLFDAHTIAKNYMKHNCYYRGTIITKNQQQFMVK